MKAASLPPRLARAKRQAIRVLKMEQGWHYLRWPVLLAGAWGCAAFLHLPQSLPDSLHALLEGGVFIALPCWALWRARRLPAPSLLQIDRRIAGDSGLPFRPLEALTDKPALADDLDGNQRREAAALWAVHRQRLLASLSGLRVRLPRLFPHWPARLVALALALCLILAGGLAGSRAGLRLKAGLLPGNDDDAAPLPVMQAWVERPAYAPGAPVFLNPDSRLPTLPEGARLHVVVEAPAGRPTLRGAGPARPTRQPNGNWQMEAVLHHDGTIILSDRGRTLGRWPATIQPDRPPEIHWAGTPGPEAHGWHTHLPWRMPRPRAAIILEARLHPVIPPARKADTGRTLIIPLPLGKQPHQTTGTAEPDLSDSPFAGLEATGRLCARSGSGKQACTQPRRFRLGHRPFHDPLGRALLSLRLRRVTGQDSPRRTAHVLGLLASLPLPPDLALPLTLLGRQAEATGPATDLDEQLWFTALYAEDRAQSGREIATSMLHVRALQNGIRLQLLRLGRQPAPPSPQEQQALHEALDSLKAALDGHMALIFQRASRNGLVMPIPGGNGMPWVHLAGKVQADALAGHIPQALEHLRAMVAPAEQMRQAGLPDMQALAASMAGQAEARNQRMALRDLIRQETGLLNHAQQRLASEQLPSDDEARHKDVSQMSTAELLSQLGMAPAGSTPSPSPGATALDPAAVLLHADARRQDHATQQALRILAETLNQRGEELTRKKNPNLLKAEKDMGPVLHDLATRQEDASVKAIQTVLNDLAQARQDMKRNQSQASKGSKGRLGFIPPPSAGRPEEQGGSTGLSPDDDPENGQDDDGQEEQKQPENRDPLGRKMDDSPQSDAHIPDHDSDRAHDIERELQRRASDRTRPQSELDYLNRLLAPLRQPR